MKEYIKPEMLLLKFDITNIIAASSIPETNGNFQTSWVNEIYPSVIWGSGDFKESWYPSE